MEPGAEAACLFYGTPGMSRAKRCADKGVASEGRGPKTGNRAATGSEPAALLRSATMLGSELWYNRPSKKG